MGDLFYSSNQINCNVVETLKLSDSQKLGSALVCWKICGICILRFNEFMYVEFVLRGTTINANAYCDECARLFTGNVTPQHNSTTPTQYTFNT